MTLEEFEKKLRENSTNYQNSKAYQIEKSGNNVSQALSMSNQNNANNNIGAVMYNNGYKNTNALNLPVSTSVNKSLGIVPIKKTNSSNNVLENIANKLAIATGAEGARERAKTATEFVSNEGKKVGESVLNAGKNLLKIPENIKDGYNFGDITKTRFGTMADANISLLKGATNGLEGDLRWVIQNIALVTEKMGKEKATEWLRNLARKDSAGWLSPTLTEWQEKLAPYSVLGSTGESVYEGTGYTLATAGTGILLPNGGNLDIGKLSIPVTTFMSSAGDAITENYSKEDVTTNQAWLNGTAKGAVSAITEGLFGVLDIGGSELDDVLVKNVTKNLDSQLAKAMAKVGIKGAGEASEEFLEYAGDYLINLATDYVSQGKGAQFFEDWNTDEVVNSMVSSFISAGMTEAGTSAINMSFGNDVVTGNNLEVQNQIDQQVKNQLQELERKGERVGTPKLLEIEDQITKKVYLENAKAGVAEKVANNEQLSDEHKDMILNLVEKSKDMNELNIYNNIANAQYNENQVQTLANKEQARQNYYENAKQNNIDVESNKEVLDSIFELASNRGVNIRYDESAFTSENQNAKWGLTEDGNREIVINPKANSESVIQNMIIHELTHDMENTQEYNTLQDLVMDYATKKGFYNNGAEADLRALYKNQIEGKTAEEQEAYIRQEATANILGEQLGNQEFINHLVNTNSQTANGVYRWVVDKLNKLNKLTGYKSEKLYWTDVKNKFEKAFGSEFNNFDSENKYAITKPNDIKRQKDGSYLDIKTRVKYNVSEYLDYLLCEDTRKTKYLPYTQSETFYELEYEEMDKAFSGCSESALQTLNSGKDSGVYNDDNYIYYYNLIGNDGNFSINDVKTIPESVKEIVNETDFEKDKKRVNESGRDESRLSNSNIDTIRNRGTSEYSSESNSAESSNVERTNSKEITRNKSKELAPTSSFSLPNNIDYKDNINHVSDIFRENYSTFKVKNQPENFNKRFSDFASKHHTDFDDFNNIAVEDAKNKGLLTRDYLNINNNLVKLTTERQGNDLWILELYVENQRQGAGTKVVKILQEYADKAGLTLKTDRELPGAKGFWDKVLNRNDTDEKYSKKSTGAFNEWLEKNTSNNKTKVPIKKLTTDTKGTLQAVHNLSAEKLQGLLDLGGIPVPSIAITNQPHTQFGDISLIFDKSTIDPSNYKNEVYDRDVWSPTFPQVDYVINDKEIENVSKNIGIEWWKLNDYAEDSNSPEYLVEKLLRNEDVIDKYIKDNNLDYKTEYKDSSFKRSYNNTEEMKEWVNKNKITLEKLSQDEKLVKKYLELTGLDKDSELYKTLENSLFWYNKDHIMNPWLKSLNNDLKILTGESEASPEIDEYKTRDNKKEVAKNNGIENYLKEQVKNIFGEKGIRNDLDTFTLSGNRRSFWQLHDKYNLSNLVKALTNKATKASQNSFLTGFGKINAQMSKQFESIEDIKNNESRLIKDVDNENLESYREIIGDDVGELANYYKYANESFNMQGFENASESIFDLAKSGNLEESNFRKILKENIMDAEKVPSALINKIITDLNNLKELGTDYFEAKPQRAVSFDEVKAVVVPNNIDSKLKQQLLDRGMNVIEYNPDVEGDRESKISSLDEYKFSKQSNGKFNEFVKDITSNNGTKTTMEKLRVPTKITTLKSELREMVNKSKSLDANMKQEMINQINETNSEEQLKEFKKDLSQPNAPVYSGTIKVSDKNAKINQKIVKEAMSIVEANNQGRRTKAQWKQIAEQIGMNIKESDIDTYANKTWIDLKPNQKENLNRQGEKFVKFTKEEWAQAIRDGYNKTNNNSKVTLEDYLTHDPNYYDGEQFDFDAHRTEIIEKANKEIYYILKDSKNIREDLQRAYDLNEQSEGNHNYLKTGLDEDNRLMYQHKEELLSSLLRTKDIKNNPTYKYLMASYTIATDYLNFRKLTKKARENKITETEFDRLSNYEEMKQKLIDMGRTEEQAQNTLTELGHIDDNRLNAKLINDIIEVESATDENQKQEIRTKIKARNHEANVKASQNNKVKEVVKDLSGKTLEVYHGTPISFDKFDPTKAGTNTNADFTGIYFTDNVNVANDFSYEQLPGNSNLTYKRGNKGNVYKANITSSNTLNLNNMNNNDIDNLKPYLNKDNIIDTEEKTISIMKEMNKAKNIRGLRHYLDLNKISQKYDVVIADMGGEYKGSNEYIVFDENNIIKKDDYKLNVPVAPTINNVLKNSTAEAQSMLQGKDISVKQGRTKSTIISNDSSVEVSRSGNIYLDGIKPTTNDFNKVGLENHFEIGDKRLVPNDSNNIEKGYKVEEWVGNQWMSEDNPKLEETKQKNQPKTIDLVSEDSPTMHFLEETRAKKGANVKQILNAFKQKFINSGQYVDILAKQVNNPELKYANDKRLSTFGEAQYSIGIAQTDNQGNEIGKSIKEIFKPAETAGLKKEFNDYLLNRINVERQAVEKSVFGDEITNEQSREIIKQYEESHPEFKEWAEDVYTYNRNELQNMVDAGLISKDLQQLFQDLYGDYVPVHRVLTETAEKAYATNKETGVTSPVKRAKGGNQQILDVETAMAENVLATKKAIRMNELGIQLAISTGHQNILEDIGYEPKWTPDAISSLNGDVVMVEEGKYLYTIFTNGEMKQFQLTKELYESLRKDTLQNKINNSEVAQAVLTPLEKMTKVQRDLLTTYSVGFMLNNPIKDFQDGLFYTKYSTGTFLKNYTVALQEIAKKGDYYKKYMAMGGLDNSYFDYQKGITSEAKGFKKVLNKIQQINGVLETAPRLAEFISSLEHGASVNEAMYNASDITTNFKRGGEYTKVINKYGANFLNASVQGLDKFVRTFTEVNNVKDGVKLVARVASLGVLPALLNGLLYKDDDDYEELEDYIKDEYYLLKLNDEGDFLRIPKGRVMATISSATRTIIEGAKGDLDVKGFLTEAEKQLAPNNPLTDNVLAPIFQVKNNKTWYGSDLVPSRLQNQLPKNQFNEKTDKISLWLGENLNISPIKINYLIDQYSGGFGDVILPMLTPQAENNIITDKFTTSAVMKNKNVGEFYDALDKYEKLNNDSKATEEEKLKYTYLSKISSKIGKLYSQKREIQMDSSITDKEKKELVKDIQREINAYTKCANDLINGEYNTESKWNMYVDGILSDTIRESDGSSALQDALYIVNNGLATKKEYMETYEKYKAQNSSVPTMKTLTKLKDNKVKLTNYAQYDLATKKYESDKDSSGNTISNSLTTKKANYIYTMNISDTQKNALLSTLVDQDYNPNVEDMKKLNGDYLTYFQQSGKSSNGKISAREKYMSFVNAEIPVSQLNKYYNEIGKIEGVKDANGKTISGSKKQAVFNYINSLSLNVGQKKLLLSTLYDSYKKEYYNDVFNYVNSLKMTKEEKQKILNDIYN